MTNGTILCAFILWGMTGFSTEALAAPSAAFDHKAYKVVRRELLRLGYQPLRFKRDANPCPDGQSVCRLYPEVISCSGTGLAACEFAWTRQGTYYTVSTVGELAPSFNAIRQVGKRERQEGSEPIAG
jgi:hypothetical protein